MGVFILVDKLGLVNMSSNLAQNVNPQSLSTFLLCLGRYSRSVVRFVMLLSTSVIISEVCCVLTPSTGDRRSHFREPLQRYLRDFKDPKDQRVLCIPFSKY